MPELKYIAPSDLLLDPENPRLPEPGSGQREVLRSLATLLDRYLIRLAADIVEHGLDPSTLPIVTPSGDDAKRYIVLEGNRRLAALKALENPDALTGAVPAGSMSELKTLSLKYQDNPTETVRCLSVKDRAEADHWIELRHTGRNEGAGILGWSSDDASRFRARFGQVPPHTQALNFLEERGLLTPQLRKGRWVTNFKRLLDTPEVRAKLGVEVENGLFHVIGDPEGVSNALMYIIDQLAEKKIKVADIYRKEQRQAFADSIPNDIVVKTSSKKKAKRITNRVVAKKIAKPPRPRPRDNLIPDGCALNVTDVRCAEIESELRNLSLSKYPNAASVLLRVFLELSVDYQIEARKIESCTVDATLSSKIRVVLDDLMQQKKITRQQAAPIRRAIQKDSFLAPSVKLMHQYLHNPYIFPIGDDLRASWNGLQPFVTAIWS